MMILRQTPVWIAAKGLLAERGADFFQCLEKTVLTYDPEGIHDLRVASRRLREALTLFEPCYPQAAMKGLRKSVRKVTSILGDLRNIDVALDFFRAEAVELGPDHGEELSGGIMHYEKNRECARKRLKKDLKKIKPGMLRKAFVNTVHRPYLFGAPVSGSVDPFTPIVDFARDSFDARLTPLLTLVSLARVPEGATAQHRLRIAVKRYRYRMEVLSPLMGDGFRVLHHHVKEYQEILGRIHDLDVFADLATGIGLSSTTEQALLGMISVKREKSVRIFLDKLDAVPFEGIGAQVRSLL